MSVRRPEKNLEVLWQRHIPQGATKGEPGFDGDDAPRVDLLAALASEVEEAIVELGVNELDNGDLVVTISRRPPIGTEED